MYSQHCYIILVSFIFVIITCFRIREKRNLAILESREKRRIEKPRLPRTAKKVSADVVEQTMGDLGVEIDVQDEDVSNTHTHSHTMIVQLSRDSANDDKIAIVITHDNLNDRPEVELVTAMYMSVELISVMIMLLGLQYTWTEKIYLCTSVT